MKKIIFAAICCFVVLHVSAQHLTSYKNESGLNGFKDQSGTIVIEPIYSESKNFSEGLAAVNVDHKWGFIDAMGKLVIPFTYDSVSDFKNGKAKAMIGNRTFYIDKAGKPLK